MIFVAILVIAGVIGLATGFITQIAMGHSPGLSKQFSTSTIKRQYYSAPESIENLTRLYVRDDIELDEFERRVMERLKYERTPPYNP